VQERALAAAVDVEHGGQFLFRALGKAINRRHPRGLATELADEKPHMPEHAAILAPLANDLGLQRVAARVEVRP
jgi:hypothetical protein